MALLRTVLRLTAVLAAAVFFGPGGNVGSMSALREQALAFGPDKWTNRTTHKACLEACLAMARAAVMSITE